MYHGTMQTLLHSSPSGLIVSPMPNSPVTLSPQQVEELTKKVARMRHDINNHLSLVVFAVEVLRTKPEMMERMTTTLSDQPPKIMADLSRFSSELEQLLGVTR